MANGKVHYHYLKKGWYLVVPLSVLVPLIALSLGSEYWFLYGLFIPLNFELCRYVDPDDDQPGLTSTEGRMMRDSKKIYMGYLGALIVSKKFIYAYFAGLFGGHRSWFSHGVGSKDWKVISTGTIGRMIFYNFLLFQVFNSLYGYAIQLWGWSTSINIWKSFYMNIWFVPYIISQLISWLIADTIHLILDTKFAKKYMYTKDGEVNKKFRFPALTK